MKVSQSFVLLSVESRTTPRSSVPASKNMKLPSG